MTSWERCWVLTTPSVQERFDQPDMPLMTLVLRGNSKDELEEAYGHFMFQCFGEIQ